MAEMERGFTWIRDQRGLNQLAQALESAPAHALDLEANSGFAYVEFLCLMQWNVGGQLWLVDLVALREANLGIDPLRPALEDPHRRTWLHGGEFDVGCLKRDYQLSVRGIWDSQQATSFLGWDRTGYGSLVERICGIDLPKQYAHYDWSKRPILPEPLQYALDDVRYLPRICETLERDIATADLEEELAIANRTVEEAEWSGGFDPDGLWKIRGIGKMEQDALPRALALNRWRDRVARSLNTPPGRVLNNKALMAMSRNVAKSTRDLRRFGLRGRTLAEHGEEILDVLRRAEANPPEVPELPQSRRPPPEERHREQRLREWRRVEAERREVPQQVVLPSRALVHLKRYGMEDLQSVPQLGDKRIRLYKDQIEQALSGGD